MFLKQKEGIKFKCKIVDILSLSLRLQLHAR